MTSSTQIRQRIADTAAKRADIEKKLAEAQRRKSTKEAEAATRLASAARTSSPSMQKAYLRQAESAQQAARTEGSKIADLSKKLATVATEESRRHKELMNAVKSETDAETRAARLAQQRRAAADRLADQQRRTEDRRRQEQRLADERRRLQEQYESDLQRSRDRSDLMSMIDTSAQQLTRQIEAIRHPKQESLRILYATASPDGDSHLRVDQEIRRVTAAVKSATHRDQVLIHHLPAATTGDLLDELTAFQPHVVHFSGHSSRGALLFDTDSPDRPGAGLVPARAFQNAMAAPDESPRLVVLNSCDSAAQLSALLSAVPMAVGMSSSIADGDAITFATRFYRSLAEGQSVSGALATARADMEMNGLQGHDLPVLLTQPDVDPTAVHLVVSPSSDGS